jgi:hypothetical protein
MASTVPYLTHWVPKEAKKDATVAFMLGNPKLPLVAREATAFSNIQSGYGNAEDRAIMDAWIIRLTLLHGTWVHDLMRGS